MQDQMETVWRTPRAPAADRGKLLEMVRDPITGIAGTLSRISLGQVAMQARP